MVLELKILLTSHPPKKTQAQKQGFKTLLCSSAGDVARKRLMNSRLNLSPRSVRTMITVKGFDPSEP